MRHKKRRNGTEMNMKIKHGLLVLLLSLSIVLVMGSAENSQAAQVGVNAPTSGGVSFTVKEQTDVPPAKEQPNGENGGKKRLPQTGESNQAFLAYAGFLLILAVGYWKKKRTTD